MTRFRSLAAVTVAVAALLAACGDDTTSQPAATVDGVRISQTDLIDELEAIGANEGYVDARTAQGGEPILGTEEGTYDTNFVASLLRLRILYTIVGEELAERGIEISDACRDAASDLAVQEAGGQDVFDAFPEAYQGELIDRQANVVALSADLAGFPCNLEDDDALLESYFAEHPEQFPARRCVSVIQVADQAAADDVLQQLEDGADFATVAEAQSIEPQTAAEGGSIGCFAPGELNEAIDAPVQALAEGEVSDVIDFAGSLVIFTVTDVQDPDPVSQRDQVVTAIGTEVDAAFNTWTDEAFGGAEVSVDPRYGTWNAETWEIDRPDAEDTTLIDEG